MALKYINEILTTLLLLSSPVMEPEVVEEIEIVEAAEVVEPSYIQVEATFYTADCIGCLGITKSGHDVRNTIYAEGKRVIAVDPRLIPLGSIVNVQLEDGQEFEAIASDIGSAIKGNIIDVLVSSNKEALQLGRQKAKVEIINAN